ncbi:profilin-like isoform X4 [Rhodamnia argentea]|uniref:Profilin-like isoform X4 n=1 Tax=Rhodamnia argentea TaxID=178133 RepID=A0ABM3HP33_9MYRT|nr:profilin-like isoform X4 [Rhodamnia argentea]
MSSYEDKAYQAAAIIGQDGKVWAQTSNFPQVKVEERIEIMREFDEPGTLTTMGLYLGGTKYVVIGVEPGDVTRAWKV